MMRGVLWRCLVISVNLILTLCQRRALVKQRNCELIELFTVMPFLVALNSCLSLASYVLS